MARTHSSNAASSPAIAYARLEYFHRTDGAGYAFWADRVLDLDAAPYADRPAYDIVVQAMGGRYWTNGG